MTDYDRRIVDLYDEANPDGPDHDFYRALADEVGARSIVDLGCGTGILTVTLAGRGRNVVGVDPSESMIDYARDRDGASAVTWVLGDSRDLVTDSADVALMTGNVAQHIGEDDWHRTLREVRGALHEGGTLAFESRNPGARAWRDWSSADRTSRDTVHGPLVEWLEVDETSPGVVHATFHNYFADADESVVEVLTLHFRERIAVERDLDAAGFTVRAVYGDWHRGPVTEASTILVFVATATENSGAGVPTG